MALGSYKVPTPFKDEDKWLRFFTKRALCYLAVAVFLGVTQFLFFKTLHLTVIGMAIFILLIMAAIALGFGTMMSDWYLFGGGERLDVLCVRMLNKHRKKNRRLYIKNYNEE